MTTHGSAPRPLRVGLISLGCAKNLVDAEIMLGALLKDGVEITSDTREADAVIVNTCSFIDAAQEESVDTILESAEVREAQNRGQALVVSGCLSQRFRDQLPRLFPEVDAFMGIDQVASVGRIVREALERRQKAEGGRQRTEGRRRKAEALVGALAELQAGVSAEPPGQASRRGTAGFGNTKTVLGPLTQPGARNTQRDAGRQATTREKQKDSLVQVEARPTYIPDYQTPRFRLTPRHFAYVKIAEGCNHPCSFCIIPRMRGSHRSRAQADVVREVRQLLKEGVKEINLISQDSTYYGLDLRPNHSRAISSPERFGAATRSLAADATTLCTLLRELNALRGEFWIRILYTHPAHWTDELIRTIAECRKVARYVDIPLQHIHDNLLERMRRETSRAHIEDLLRRIRSGVPGIALRTTFIVGFPGETRGSFESLLEFIREAQFERLGVFAYSKEDGTRAGVMAGQVPAREKQRRREQAMAAQHAVAVRVAESFVGRTLKVLVEGEATAKQLQQARVSSWEHGLIRAPDGHVAQLKGRYRVARGEADAPDIDGRVYIRGEVPIGQFADVRVIGHTDYDLMAELV
ncbi:MAG: MiaB/RimO family radical SAM methylthiotransferase [Verrucomicrobia bacterium]|jgi:ribosomal protein S12 methylthiotransferase|nr:MiaB/RimO family radical SAM methylthiotransferase [Verrucomicrobiota bacterium]